MGHLFGGLSLYGQKKGQIVRHTRYCGQVWNIAKRDQFGVLNLRVGLEGDNWNVTAFADNLLDRKYINEAIPAIEFGGSFISPGARRLMGVEVGYKF